MITFVIKKDGTKVPFDSEKIKSAIMKAASQAGVSSEESSMVSQKVIDSVNMAFENREEVNASEIREKVLSELDMLNSDISMSWKKYEESMGK